MAVNATHLFSGADATDSASYTSSSSISPSAGTLVLAFVKNSKASSADVINSITGNNLTWSSILSGTFDNSNSRRLSAWGAVATSPTSGTPVIDFNTVVQTGLCYSFFECSGVDVASGVAGAVVQSVFQDDGGVIVFGITVTLATFASASNGTVGGFAKQFTGDVTPGSNFTELGEAGHSGPTSRVQTQWAATEFNSFDASWPVEARSAGLALEIKATAGGDTLTRTAGKLTTVTF